MLFDLIPEDLDRLMSGHAFPISEAAGELEDAIQLAFRGFYRQAFATLRVVLELGLFSVYLDAADQSHLEITPWLAGGLTPHPKMMLARLKVLPNFNDFFSRFAFQHDVLRQYDRLNAFVHVRGARHSARALNETNVRAFSDKALTAVVYHAHRAVRYIAALHVLKYPIALQVTPIDEKFGLNPPVGTFITPYQGQHLRDFLGADWASVLQSTSDADEAATELAKHIQSMPDLTDDDWKEQALAQDKFQISQQGFESWQLTGSPDYSGDDEEERHRWAARKATLLAWATANDVLDAAGARRFCERRTKEIRAMLDTGQSRSFREVAPKPLN